MHLNVNIKLKRYYNVRELRRNLKSEATMCTKKLNKEKVLKWMNRAGITLFISLVLLQAIILARYPSIYWKNEWGNLMILGFVLSLILWCMNKNKSHKEQIERLWIVWLVYVISLLISIAIIFGALRSKLDKNHILGPNALKLTMCITPGIALVLFITTPGAEKKNRDVIAALCGDVAVDLFDYIEVLVTLLPHSGTVLLPDGIAGSTIAFVILSLLLSVMEVGENKAGKDGELEYRERLYLWRLILKIPVNFALLIIRLIVWLEYKHDASIFIAKNAIIILIMIYSIMSFFFDKNDKEKEAKGQTEMKYLPKGKETPVERINHAMA